MISNLKTKISLPTTFGAITAWALMSGFYQVFSIFPPYDDEGYLMMTVKQFTNGGVLYDEVYTQYGPAYYFYQWLLHALSGLPVTHDVTRLTTLIVWTLTAMLCGIFTYRVTRSTIFSAVSYILTFLILFRTVYEPGHPQELCGLLIALILLLLTDGESERGKGIRLSILAALLAGLCLIKINLGIFVGLGLAIAFVTFSGGGRWRRGALFILNAIAAALPFIIFRKYFSDGWLKLCVLIAVMIISAIVNGSLRRKKVEIFAKHYFLMAAAFGAATFLIILFVLLKGTSSDALLHGVLLQHLKFGDDFFQTAPIQRFAIFWGFLVLAAALMLAYWRRRYISSGEIALNVAKIGFGLFVILCSLFGYAKFINTFLLLSFVTPLLWLLTVDSSPDDATRNNKLAKTALIYIAVLLTLQIFPIAGTQMAYGSFLMSVSGVLCLSEGIASLRNSLAQKFYTPYLRIGLVSVSAVLLAFLGVHRFYANYTIYYRQIPVKLYGANHVRLPEKDAALYTFLVENLKSQCDAFVSMPGIYSLNFWAQIESPTTFNATAWMTLLDDAQQQTIVEKLKNRPRVCAVYHPQLTQNGARNRRLESLPLASYILNDFVTKGTVNEYRLMTEKDSSEELVYAAKIVPNQQNLITFTLPKQSGWIIARIQLYDLAQQQILADSQETLTSVFTHEGKPATFPLEVMRDTAISQHVNVSFASLSSINFPKQENLVLRLFDGEGNLTASLPFAENR